MKKESVYIRKCKELKSLREQYKRIVKSGNGDKDIYIKMKLLDKELKLIESSVGMNHSTGGNYKKSINDAKFSWLKFIISYAKRLFR